MVKYIGLTYKGNAPYVNVQMLPYLTKSVVVKKNRLYRFKDHEAPTDEEMVNYYRSLRLIGVELVEGASSTKICDDDSSKNSSESHRSIECKVNLDESFEIKVDPQEYNKVVEKAQTEKQISRISSEMSDEEMMEYLDSNFSDSQLVEFARKYGVEIDTTSSESLSVQLVVNKNSEFSEFLFTQLL